MRIRRETHRLNISAFHAALDARRTALGISWREVARLTGTSPSTLTRIGQGRAPDVHTFLSLTAWVQR